jgi:membrane fusion protein (multidrug efflux system)
MTHRWVPGTVVGRRGRAIVGYALVTLTVAACSGAKADAAGRDSLAPWSAREQSTEAGASNPPADSAPAVALPVVTEDAADADLVLRVSTTGQVRSEAVVPLKAEVAGTVLQLLVRPGQSVAAGQPLVKFDPYPFDLATREAQARSDEAEQRFLESYVPESLVTSRGPTPEQRRALMNKAGLIGARLQLERARYEQTRALITSPVAGVVQVINVATGEKVAAGQAIATVVDTRRLVVETQVLEHDLPLVRVGGEALVTSAGAPGDPVRGRIEAVLPLVDSVARAGRAVVRVASSGVLRPGMYADVQLEATRLRNRRLVPTRAVIERDGRPLVFVVKDGRAQWTYIVPGRSNGTFTEVLPDSSSGDIPVCAGDAVIVDGHLTLTHDAPVRVVRDRERNGQTNSQTNSP